MYWANFSCMQLGFVREELILSCCVSRPVRNCGTRVATSKMRKKWLLLQYPQFLLCGCYQIHMVGPNMVHFFCTFIWAQKITTMHLFSNFLQTRGLSSENNFLSPAPAFYKTWFRFSHSYRKNFNNNSLFLAHFISNQICLSFNECYRHRFPIHHLSSLTTDCLFQMKELIFWLFVTNLQ